MDFTGKDFKSQTFRRRVEEELYDSFKKFLWFNQVFCAAPIQLNLLEANARKRDKYQKFISAIHLIFGLSICVAVCLATYYQNQDFDTTIGFMTRILYMGEYVIGTFNLVLVILSCQYQKKFYSFFFERLVSIDVSLRKCGCITSFESTRTYLSRSMGLYGAFFAAVIVIDFMYNRMHGESFIRSSTVYTIPNVVSALALTQYSMVLHYIHGKFKSLNTMLERIVKDNSTEAGKLSFVPAHCSGTGIVVGTLRKQHGELSRLMEILNGCFGLLIILTVVAAYIILSTQFYAFYKMSEGFDEDNIWLTIYTILWIILHSFKVFLVLFSVNRVSDDKRRTGLLLFGVDSPGYSKLQPEIKMFADQLLHDSEPPNAMKIINLDLTIVGTMVGVLTTYLIILIQFDANSREQGKLICNMTNSSS